MSKVTAEPPLAGLFAQHRVVNLDVFFGGKSLTERMCGDAPPDFIRWNVLRHDCAGRHNGTAPNRNPSENYRAESDPSVGAYGRSPQRFWSAGEDDRDTGAIPNVVATDDRDSGAEHDVWAKFDARSDYAADIAERKLVCNEITGKRAVRRGIEGRVDVPETIAPLAKAPSKLAQANVQPVMTNPPGTLGHTRLLGDIVPEILAQEDRGRRACCLPDNRTRYVSPGANVNGGGKIPASRIASLGGARFSDPHPWVAAGQS